MQCDLRADDVWLSGVFSWSWQWSFNRVAAIDVPSKTIPLRYGERSGITDQYSHDYFFAENLLEEIDQPGEYFLDRTTGILFLLPPDRFGGNDTTVCLSMLTAPLAVFQTHRIFISTGSRSMAAVPVGSSATAARAC